MNIAFRESSVGERAYRPGFDNSRTGGKMRTGKLFLAGAFGVCVSLLHSATAFAIPVYGTSAAGFLTGSRSILLGGLTKGGGTATAAQIDWVITFNTTYYHYSYTVDTNSQQGIGHALIDLSLNCLNTDNTVADPLCLYDTQVTGGTLDSVTYGSFNSSGNPFLPGTLTGAKITWTGGTSDFTFEFNSNRVPVWEDFYAKLGNGDTNGLSVFNTGLGAEGTDSNIGDFIPFPDSVLVVTQQFSVSEPATLALFGLGLIGLGTLRRRRKSKV